MSGEMVDQDVLSAKDKPGQEIDVPSKWTVGRFATLFLIAPQDKSPDEITSSIVQSLDKDSRVVSVEHPALDPKWDLRPSFYPACPDPHSDSLIDGSDEFQSLRLSEPIEFRIHVPRKNQPTFSDIDEIPAEDYLVHWNGVALLVCWEQEKSDVPIGGGHVAADILGDAARESGGDLYIQACNPHCDYVFVHTSIRVEAEAYGDIEFQLDHQQHRIVETPLTNGDDLESVADELFYEIAISIENFAELKNTTQRIKDIERAARNDLSDLLFIQYDHTRRSTQPTLIRLRKLWQHRTCRKQSRMLISRLWLSLSNLELLKRQWDEARLRFEEEAEENNKSLLFTRDHPDDVAAIESLDLSRMQSTLEQAAARLDNRDVVIATAWGALGGAVAGALVGLLQ